MASSRRLAQVDWKSTGIFLRNIPAKCDEQTLRNFVQAKRVTDFSAEMAVFPNGNAKGFASFRFSERSAMQDFVSKVHGQFIPQSHDDSFAVEVTCLRHHSHGHPNLASTVPSVGQDKVPPGATGRARAQPASARWSAAGSSNSSLGIVEPLLLHA
eukprot:s2899_g10.t1